MPFYSIVIPTYNEKDNVCVLIQRLLPIMGKQFGDNKYEIIIVDDNSPDLTWKLVGEKYASEPKVKVIRRLHNRGLSQSIIEGFEKSNGDFLLAMDADLQHDENIVPDMFLLASSNDLVSGTRFSSGGSIEGEWPFFRRLMSYGAIWTAKIVLGIKLSDPMSGFFAMPRKTYTMVAPYLDPRGFKIFLEILYILKCLCPTAKIAEKGIHFRKRDVGKSKLGFEVIANYFYSLLQLRMRKKKIHLPDL